MPYPRVSFQITLNDLAKYSMTRSTMWPCYERKMWRYVKASFLCLYFADVELSYILPISTLELPHYNHRAMDHHIAVQWLVHWPLMGGLLHLVHRGGDWVGLQPTQAGCCTKCNSPPINGQRTNFVLFDVAL